MFCQKCGKEINDEAVICVGCGCPVTPVQSSTPSASTISSSNSKPVQESNSTANCALLFAFLIPIVGFIMGIVGACKYKTPSFKSKCITAIVISVIVEIILIAIISSIGI